MADSTGQAEVAGGLRKQPLEQRPSPNGALPKDGACSGMEFLPADRCRQIHRVMVRSRVMEERMIKMAKSGEGYFWIGGPGEEAFNACLGFQIKKGRGPEF